MELTNTTAVITGATGHLGEAIAISLAEHGCDCICHYHTKPDIAADLVKKIQAFGRKAVAVQADLNDPDQLARLFCINGQDWPGAPIRILINLASNFKRQPLAKITKDSARQSLDINLIAPVLISKEFAKTLTAQKTIIEGKLGAKIINFADVGGITPWANYTMYCASKAGLISVTKSLAKELAPAVCVNAIAPGMVSFPENGDKDEYKRQLKMIPANRKGTPEEIAAAMIFLLQNDYITGQTLNVDGGRCI
jgi:NAD(P)-dependent dehydrogenase (short-subunit alcohol dehydrogenase family)